MWMLLERYICHTYTSGLTQTQTYWVLSRYVSSHSVSNHQSTPSLSNLRTCPIPYTHPSIPQQGTHHNQVTHLRPLAMGHSLGTRHKEGGTLHTQLQDILKQEVIRHQIQGIHLEEEVTHLILHQLSLALPDQEQLQASARSTSRQVSSLLSRTR